MTYRTISAKRQYHSGLIEKEKKTAPVQRQGGEAGLVGGEGGPDDEKMELNRGKLQWNAAGWGEGWVWVLNHGIKCKGHYQQLGLWGVTCQGFLQLVSVVGTLQQASQRNDNVFKARPFGRVLSPTVLKTITKQNVGSELGPHLHVDKCMCACVCNLRAYQNSGTGSDIRGGKPSW
jgi:hypothetical protein